MAELSRQALDQIAYNTRQIKSPLQRSTLNGKEIISSENSYINNIPNSSKSIIWNRFIMPLKVYITTSKKPEHKQIAWEAFKAWQHESENFVAFERIDAQKDADVIVYWNDSTKNISNKDYGGYTVNEVKDDHIKLSKIYLNEVDNKNNEVTPAELYSYSLHQIGHCLGISSHSDSEYDAMYATSNQGKVTRRDKNTLMLLYGAGLSETKTDQDNK